MGASHSSIRILVVGLTGSGKTHLLDLLSGECAAGRPTNGYHEVTYDYEGYRFIFTEYGGAVDWEKLIKLDTGPPFGCVYMVMGKKSLDTSRDFSPANNALLMLSTFFPTNVPFAVIWNRSPASPTFQYPRNRRVCSVTLDFEATAECLEKIYRLLRWTSAQSNIA